MNVIAYTETKIFAVVPKNYSDEWIYDFGNYFYLMVGGIDEQEYEILNERRKEISYNVQTSKKSEV